MKLKCPDCYSEVLITPPKKKPSRARPSSDNDEELYRLSDPVEVLSPAYLATQDLVESVRQSNAVGSSTESAADHAAAPPRPLHPPSQTGARFHQAEDYMRKAREEIEAREAEADPPPESPLNKGLISYLFDFEAVVRWVFLAVFGYLVFCVVNVIVLADDVHPLLRLVMTVILAPIILIYLDCAAVCFMAIVQDTSSGFDKVRNWPGMNFLDWMWDGFYIINCLWVSSLLGILAGTVFGCFPPVVAVLMGMISMAGLFPILFMSVLEQGSPLGMASPKVWQSLKSHRDIWRAFYLRSLGLVLAAAAAMSLCLVGWFLLDVLAIALVVTVSMVYFRLIGRLAWCLSEADDETSG